MPNISRLADYYHIIISFGKNKLRKDFVGYKNTKHRSKLINPHEIEGFSLKKKTQKTWLSRNKISPILTSSLPGIKFSKDYHPRNGISGKFFFEIFMKHVTPHCINCSRIIGKKMECNLFYSLKLT